MSANNSTQAQTKPGRYFIVVYPCVPRSLTCSEPVFMDPYFFKIRLLCDEKPSHDILGQGE
ncbi:hypothetical protein, partial [Thiolapillus sp.]|uniref:hypothetical protein n=1 Tax=Thiolapillus sp. TaxID=2017437 RepID=UPI003AF77593